MVRPNEFLRTEMNVLSRGFIPPEEVAAVERQPIAMVRSHTSWGSVIAGSILTLALLALSSSLALACGVPAFSGAGDDYGVGAGIWSVVTAIIAFGSGGWLAACLASTLDGRYRYLQGVLTWGLTVVLALLLFEGAGLVAARIGVITADIREMILFAPRVGPAWGAFISLAVGLFAAMIGGALMDTRVQQEIKT